MRLEKSMQLFLSGKLSAYQTMQEKLSQLDPLRVLQRGYAAVYHENGKLLSSVRETQPGEPLTVRLSDGSLQVKVETVNEL